MMVSLALPVGWRFCSSWPDQKRLIAWSFACLAIEMAATYTVHRFHVRVAEERFIAWPPAERLSLLSIASHLGQVRPKIQ